MNLPLNTPLTKLLDIKTPIISAAMAGAAGGDLAASVSLAGGFGFIGAGYYSLEKLNSELALAREACKMSPLPIGVGFLVWLLEALDDGGFSLIDAVLEQKVQAIWFSFGQNVGKYVDYVRNHPMTRPVIFVPVSTPEAAVIAVEEWKVDAVIAQGIESGGHGFRHAPPLLTLIPSIVSALPPGFPIIAAGGLATGSQIAAVLAVGAAGACLGTRFLLTPESLYTPVQKQALITASSHASVRTTAFDEARGTLGWPEGIDGRGVCNATVADFNNGARLNELRKHYTVGVRNQDPDRLVVWAGAAVGLMDGILPAKEIVQEFHQSCVKALQSTNTYMSPTSSG